MREHSWARKTKHENTFINYEFGFTQCWYELIPYCVN